MLQSSWPPLPHTLGSNFSFVHTPPTHYLGGWSRAGRAGPSRKFVFYTPTIDFDVAPRLGGTVPGTLASSRASPRPCAEVGQLLDTGGIEPGLAAFVGNILIQDKCPVRHLRRWRRENFNDNLKFKISQSRNLSFLNLFEDVPQTFI